MLFRSTRWQKTASGGETSLSGTGDNGIPLTYTLGIEQVYLNGVLLVRDSDYTASTGTTITGLTALSAGDFVEIISILGFEIANAIQSTIINAKGDIIVGSAPAVPTVLPVGTTNAYQTLTPDSTSGAGVRWGDDLAILQILEGI